MKKFRVGGYVRDKLLGLAPKDADWVVVGATPELLESQGYQRVGRDFPVFLHPDTKQEYALARTERKTGPGYRGFSTQADPAVTLEEDLLRRDLTINAMAEAEDGTLIDPYGGEQDLRSRILRHVSPAFVEDPVRILRVARFAARFAHLGFQVAEPTIALMREMVANGEVNALVPERVQQEFLRALGEAKPSVFFAVLRECGALQVILPEINRLFGVPQRAEYHPEVDTGVHTLMVVDRAAELTDDTQVRFAALVHDLGKGTTPQDILPRHTDHEIRSVDLVKALCKRLRLPNEHRDLAVAVAHYHGVIHRAAELKASTILRTLERLDAWRRPSRFEQMLIACQADAQGRLGKENEPYPQAEIFQIAFAATQTVTADAFLAAGVTGKALGEQIRRARLQAIKLALSAAAPPLDPQQDQ